MADFVGLMMYVAIRVLACRGDWCGAGWSIGDFCLADASQCAAGAAPGVGAGACAAGS